MRHACLWLALGLAIGARAATARAGWMAPNFQDEVRQHGAIYVADRYYQWVDVFSKAPPYQPLARITDNLCFPADLAVDRRGTLYVANAEAICNANFNNIDVYPAGQVVTSRVITDKIYGPFALAVSPRDDALYMADYYGHNILKFPAGSSKAAALFYPLGSYPRAVAIDPNGTLYAGYQYALAPPYPAYLGHYAGSPGAFADTGIPVRGAYQIGFDSAGNLLVLGAHRDGLDVFPPGATKPSRHYPGAIVGFALDEPAHRLYTTNYQHGVHILSYPDGKLVGSIPAGFFYNAISIAVSGPAAPGGR